jgi:hypothetical protein
MPGMNRANPGSHEALELACGVDPTSRGEQFCE